MKNKLNFFLSALLVLLFITGLNTCSYASWYDEYTLDDNMVNYIFDYFGNSGDAYYSNKSSVFTLNSISTFNDGGSNSQAMQNSVYSTKFYNESNKKAFKIAFNNLNKELQIPIGNYVFLPNFRDQVSSQISYIYIDAFPVNMTNSDDYPYFTIYQRAMSSSYQQGQSIMSFKLQENSVTSATRLRFKITTDSVTTSTHTLDYTSTYNVYYILRGTTNVNNIFDYYNNSDTTLISKINICSLLNMPLYSTVSLTQIGSDLDTSYAYLLKSLYVHPVTEDSENPDDSGTSGSGTTGTITNPSGDTTGKVDLSGIENGIDNINQGIVDVNSNLNNIENKIPTSGEIKDSQVAGNKEFWGNTEDINPEDFENELENNFNGIMENLSGELTQNQIFESLQGAEDGFLNFFREEQNEQFYDLAFSWPDVEFMGEILIPAGGINISEMCREIPELETLRSYIRVIFNFSVAVALIKQIYNLILSTLGIDNPYLYEDSSMETEVFEDMDTGQSYVTYSGRATDGSRYRIRSNHTKVKKHNKIGF